MTKLERTLGVAWLLSAFAVLNAGEPGDARGAEALHVAPFKVDVTPAVGEGPCVGFMPKVERIEHPLELRGIVLRADSLTFVIAAIDYCGISNSSDEAIRGAMARAAGTTIDRVALQSLHQHSAPILDADAVRILHGAESRQLAGHLRFTEDVATRTATAIAESLDRLRPVSRIVATKARVDRFASNRRVPQADGSIGVRASTTRDLAVREAPEGLIDPWLRTLTFYDGGDRRLVQVHYYASHPQTVYGDGRISWDTVGMARQRWERESGAFQVYFTGCGGNVAAGKYNDGTPTARDALAERLLDAMRRSSDAGSEAAEPKTTVDIATLAKGEIAWDSAPIRFSAREDGEFHPARLAAASARDRPFMDRVKAAMLAGFAERLRGGYVARATRLRIGAIDLVHLPGEPFVEFQLFAQRAVPAGSFVCVAGYGECGVWYYGPDSIYRDRGGYEQTWSVTRPCQGSVEGALVQLLTREERLGAGPGSRRLPSGAFVAAKYRMRSVSASSYFAAGSSAWTPLR